MHHSILAIPSPIIRLDQVELLIYPHGRAGLYQARLGVSMVDGQVGLMSGHIGWGRVGEQRKVEKRHWICSRGSIGYAKWLAGS
jgi:hypothetical protein